MESYRQQFVKFLIDHKALLFGDFTLKSGRTSPYFFNAGQFNTSKALAQLGKYYAQAIIESKIDYDILFGPAYKGIPIATCVAVALADRYNLDIPVCFNRKEVKPYGEGGNLIGAPLQGRVLVVDDVVSSGTTFRESAKLISEHPAQIVGIITALDRQERGSKDVSAITEIQQHHNIKTITIIKLDDIIEFLSYEKSYQSVLNNILTYQQRYGHNN